MSLAAKLLSASGGGVDKLYVDDVFSAFTYTGNGSTQTINNGIDLLGKGGLVWTKVRSTTYDHRLIDTTRGTTQALTTNNIGAQISTTTDFSSFSSTGYALGAPASSAHYNSSGATYVSWTFRKAPKFFDVVTYTGNGVAGRQIPHALGIAPGMIITKCTSGTNEWVTWHRSASGVLTLNTPNATSGSTIFGTVTDNYFSVGSHANPGWFNENDQQFVAYLFAHDTSADGIVQCGSFTTDGGYEAIVDTLGWEPQFLLTKSSSATGDWIITDSARAFASKPASNARLLANTSAAESSSGTHTPLATGFRQYNLSTATANIYLAIRRPNKPPTLGTQVYNAIARTGTGTTTEITGIGFPPDAAFIAERSKANSPENRLQSRLTGSQNLNTNSTTAEGVYSGGGFLWNTDGVTLPGVYFVTGSGMGFIDHYFRRAPGVFDVVCYTGTGVAKTEAHSLGVVPELMIVKSRSLNGMNWQTYQASLGATKSIFLNLTSAVQTNTNYWNNTEPSATNFTVGDSSNANFTSATYVAYLFATLPGISKVGSYTGNGTTQTINCGFTTGARFILIKRTDAAGDWYVWDTVRGLVAGNDPHLSLNTTAAEVTGDDSIDPASVGFIVNQLAATNINVTSASYIYLSFA